LTLETDFSFLAKALSYTPELKQIINESYNPEYLKYVDELLHKLYDYNCKGIEIKVSETSTNPYGFQALISELEFARFFAENKMYIELLSCNAWDRREPPDMLATNSNEYVIEVKNIQLDDEEYTFGMKIVEVLNSLNMSVMVIIKSSRILSTPAYLHQSRKQKEISCEKALSEFKSKLHNISPASFPITISTSIADIELHSTNVGKSYLGITTMKEAISEPAEYKERIRYDIMKKARKRDKWIDDELEKFYIVCIDDASWLFNIDTYNMELFGYATYYCHPLPIPETKVDSKIENTIKNGWEDYLKKMYILPNNRTVIPENRRGMFFTEEPMKNVTAIIVRGKGYFYLLANPFAEERINNPNIFRCFTNYKIGWNSFC
jgi:hypothetical protein